MYVIARNVVTTALRICGNCERKASGEKMENFDEFRIGNIPTLMYVPDFISETEETHLLNKIYEAPVSKWMFLKNRRLQNWGGLVHHKGLVPQDLPAWLTTFTERIYEKSAMFPSTINHILINEYQPNQGIMPHQDGPAYFPVAAILSLKSPVVMDFTPHSKLSEEKGPSEKFVGTKGSDAEVFPTETDETIECHHPFSVVLMPRSLLIFKDQAYSDYLHGIKDRDVHEYDGAVNQVEALRYHGHDLARASSGNAVEASKNEDSKIIHRSSTRVSLTCRRVMKVHKNVFKF